jgi:hypothetical protein
MISLVDGVNRPRCQQGSIAERGGAERALFDEQWCLSRYADGKAAIAEGAWPSVDIHFQVVGRSEGRLPIYIGNHAKQRAISMDFRS